MTEQLHSHSFNVSRSSSVGRRETDMQVSLTTAAPEYIVGAQDITVG